MPKRIKCCDPHCNDVVVCSPTEQADWFYNWTGAQTYQTDACVGGKMSEGDCDGSMTFDWDFDYALGVCFQGHEEECETCGEFDYDECGESCGSCQCKTWNNFAGAFGWTDVGGAGGSNSYAQAWDGCDPQGCAGALCGGESWMAHCFGNMCGGSGPCPAGSGGLFSDCSDISTGYATWYTATQFEYAQNFCTNIVDATWRASGFRIHGNIDLFNPSLTDDQCDNYRTMIRRITLQGTGSSNNASCRVTWYFSGNPITGSTVETCYYHDYGGTYGNAFEDSETWWDYQTQWGLYGSGGSTTLHLYARIEDGDNDVIHDITNGSVQIYYKRPKKYRMGISFAQNNLCGGSETPSLHCDDDYCCDDICNCYWTTFGWSSPYVQKLTTADATEEWDNCPNGSNFGSFEFGCTGTVGVCEHVIGNSGGWS